jgi:hypothetical protein
LEKISSPTPEDMEQYTPQVDWEAISQMYLPGRTPVECRNEWLNNVAPFINQGKWTREEDKTLLAAVKNNGGHHWETIAKELGVSVLSLILLHTHSHIHLLYPLSVSPYLSLFLTYISA